MKLAFDVSFVGKSIMGKIARGLNFGLLMNNTSPHYPVGTRNKAKQGKKVFYIGSVLFWLVAGCLSQVIGQTSSIGFEGKVKGTELSKSSLIQFAPDSRVFVAEKNGLINIFDDLSTTTSTLFTDLRKKGDNSGKNGLLAIALDPKFPTNPYVYILYTYKDSTESSSTPSPLPLEKPTLRPVRLSRLRSDGNEVIGVEEILVEDWYKQYPGKAAQGITFDSNGMLYVTSGEDTNSTLVEIKKTDSANSLPSKAEGKDSPQIAASSSDPVNPSRPLAKIGSQLTRKQQHTNSLVVGPPTVDANGVKSYSATSVYQGSQPTTVRVLEPTNPTPGLPHRFLYVMPVESGVPSLSSVYSDGLEELRVLNIHNRYNLTLIAPSFHIEPWYGDHDTNPDRRLESFIVQDLVPFGDTFETPGVTPERWVIGVSKSGSGALRLILRHSHVFNASAAWDAPAQFTDMSAFPGMQENFGSEANFDHYEIPPLVIANAPAFSTLNRLWISGDQSAWTSHMSQLHTQMDQAGVLHTWITSGVRTHAWYSGWLEGAVAALKANATPVAQGPVAA